MKGFLLFVAGAVVGGIVSFVVAGGVMTGVGAVGIVTGLKTGACLTVEAAKAEGFITATQVDQVLQSAGRLISDTEVTADDGKGLTDAECERLIDQMKSK